MNDQTTPAHVAWDETWGTKNFDDAWLKPDQYVLKTVETLAKRGATKVLDLGCGVGRHAIFFAEQGFETYAIDASEQGIALLREQATIKDLRVDAQKSLMTSLPYPSNFFDHVLAFNVIYHGNPDEVVSTISEIVRVLKPTGTYYGTMLSTRNVGFGVGTEIDINTFVDLEGEKGHPHYYCDERQLRDLFQELPITELVEHEQHEADSWHWYLLCTKP